MKKNISINLFGTLYAIDEDAYALLEKYMDSMKSYFASQEGGEEIADDIEHRVAELLWQQKQGGAEAVNIDDIKNIIKTIGNPADFEAEAGTEGSEYAEEVKDENNEETTKTTGTYESNNYSQHYGNSFDSFKQRMAGRHLYRDPFRKVLGGVCSGLSVYFNYGDPVMWRLAFVLIPILMPVVTSIFTSITGFFGLNFTLTFPVLLFWVPVLYVVLLIVIPEARTPEDRLRMQGKEVNPENIQEEVLNEANGIFGGTQYYSTYNSYSSSKTTSGSSYSTSSSAQKSSETEGETTTESVNENSNATDATSSSFTDNSSASQTQTKSADEEKAERERRARVASEQYYYYKKNQSSTGANVAKGCGIGCILVLFSPFIVALFVVLFMILMFAFIGVMVPFGLVFGDHSTFHLNIGPSMSWGDEYISWDMIAQDYPWVVFVGSLAAIVFVIIPLYALFRRLKSDRNRYSAGTRTAFAVTWIVSLVVAVGSLAFIQMRYQKECSEAFRAYNSKQKAEHTINGIEYNDTDFRFFTNNGWQMIEADNCSEDRYTYDGMYMNGDRDVRYLDACCDDWDSAVRYTARATETLQPGRYRLVANCRAENKGSYIYCYNDKNGKDKTMKYADIPAFGDNGGNIWQVLVDSTYKADPIVKSIVDEFKNEPVGREDDEVITKGKQILDANWGEGFGWSVVYIDDIVVKEPLTYCYGVTTVKDGKCVAKGWFSATDFRFVRIGD